MSTNISTRLNQIAQRMEEFEASASMANTGTGSRREGSRFETLVAEYWSLLADYISERGASRAHVPGPRKRTWARLSSGNRSILLPELAPHGPLESVQRTWLDLDFEVDDLLAAYPGRQEAVDRYAPQSGPYKHEKYPEMFSGMKTKFDDTIVLEDNGILREKILVEYKTAKSSTGRQIDGNAHERLSFQIMQYLELATRYTKCSFLVLTNGAFIRYRNKYHLNFHIQADRLANFSWFEMEHACHVPEYKRTTDRIVDWLFADTTSQ
jgi:hypothetical protein